MGKGYAPSAFDYYIMQLNERKKQNNPLTNEQRHTLRKRHHKPSYQKIEHSEAVRGLKDNLSKAKTKAHGYGYDESFKQYGLTPAKYLKWIKGELQQ